MQPYRTAAHPTDPRRPGAHLCQADDCEQLATHQVVRHATQVEYDALPEALRPVDGVVHKAIFACDDHEIEPVACAHPEPVTVHDVACPRCSAPAGQPCLTARGTPRGNAHKARHDAVAAEPATVCRHAHAPECDPFAGCSCDPNAPLPARQPRSAPLPEPPRIPLIPIPAVNDSVAWFATHGIDLNMALDLRITPAAPTILRIEAEVWRSGPNGEPLHDEHGRPLTRHVNLLLSAATGELLDAPPVSAALL